MQLKDFTTLAEAQAYEATQEGYITANTMNSLLADEGIYVAMKRITETDGHPAQNALAAFFDPRSTDYNFIIGDPTGDKQIALLDGLIAAGPALSVTIAGQTVDLAAKLASLKPTLIFMCNRPYKPFESATQHDFAVAKNDPTRFKAVSNEAISQGYLKITTTADCEPHRPSVYKQVHGEYIRVTSFPVVSAAGDYIALVTNHRDLFIDNVYNVVA